MKLTEAQKQLLAEMADNNNKITVMDQRRMKPLRTLHDMGLITLRAFEVGGKMGMKAEITSRGLNEIS